jgi:predicted secreted protein
MFGISFSSIIAWAAIYVVVWWITIFTILPIGVRSQDEAGEVTPGSERGAPVAPHLAIKAAVTSVISAVIVVLIYVLRQYLDTP